MVLLEKGMRVASVVCELCRTQCLRSYLLAGILGDLALSAKLADKQLMGQEGGGGGRGKLRRPPGGQVA